MARNVAAAAKKVLIGESVCNVLKYNAPRIAPHAFHIRKLDLIWFYRSLKHTHADANRDGAV